jgi:hypothetical protein
MASHTRFLTGPVPLPLQQLLQLHELPPLPLQVPDELLQLPEPLLQLLLPPLEPL